MVSSMDSAKAVTSLQSATLFALRGTRIHYPRADFDPYNSVKVVSSCTLKFVPCPVPSKTKTKTTPTIWLDSQTKPIIAFFHQDPSLETDKVVLSESWKVGVCVDQQTKGLLLSV